MFCCTLAAVSFSHQISYYFCRHFLNSVTTGRSQPSLSPHHTSHKSRVGVSPPILFCALTQPRKIRFIHVKGRTAVAMVERRLETRNISKSYNVTCLWQKCVSHCIQVAYALLTVISKFSAPTIAFLAFWLAKKLRLWANSRSFTSYGK